eukprot:maker-scaffold_34-snap-gene-0.3-mRNA-1 protein AED:0.01 eAED:0.01 QI:93/1/1/1/0.5/0.33/3/393/258
MKKRFSGKSRSSSGSNSSKCSRKIPKHDPNDLYNILEIPRDADELQIKKAYRKLAMKYHPDKNKDSQEEAAENFKRVAEAFEILSDTEKREYYDKYGRKGTNSTSYRSPDQGFNFSRAAEIFENFFGGDPFLSTGFGFANSVGTADLFSSFGDGAAGSGAPSFGFDSFGHTFGMGNFPEMHQVNNISTSSSSFISNGVSKSTTTVTEIVNGERVTRTETKIVYPDGRVETNSSETRGSHPQLGSSTQYKRAGFNLDWF